MGPRHGGTVDERLFDGTTPTPEHSKPGIAFTVHCARIRISSLLLRCFLVKKEGAREKEKKRRTRTACRRRSVTLDRSTQTYRETYLTDGYMSNAFVLQIALSKRSPESSDTETLRLELLPSNSLRRLR